MTLAFGGFVCLTLLAGAARQKPAFEAWGIALRQPVDLSSVEVRSCMTGREFAFRSGRYRITADDALLNVPHEHGDSAAVLAALDSIRACLVTSREHRFAAMLTLRDSIVVEAALFWPDTATRLSVDSAAAYVARRHGAPTVNEAGVRIWAADSANVYVSRRGMFSDGTSLRLSDRAACEWFERIVHRRTPRVTYVDAESNDCWVPPKRAGAKK